MRFGPSVLLGWDRFRHSEKSKPVTPKQTRVLRERFGDIAANEIVDMLNNVEASSLTELRTLNELNFARFDAKVEQRFAESDAKWEKRFAEYEWEKRCAEADARLEKRFADFEGRFLRWMFAYWSTNLLAFAGLAFAVLRTR